MQGARPLPTWTPRKAVGALLSPQESQHLDKNHVKITAQSELWISGNLRNGEGPENREHKTKENREGDPISEGLSLLRLHGGHGPEGELSSHLGGRPRKKKKEGALCRSLPVAAERRRG